MRIRLSEKELKTALKSLVIQIDTREQKEHIEGYFNRHNIAHKRQKLNHGDFSCYIPKGAIKGLDFDLTFDRYIVIERKSGIDELAGNFSKKDYPRISKEFAQLKANGTKCFIFVEDHLFDKHLRLGNYRSQYAPIKLYARLKGFEAEYGTVIRPVDAKYIGSEIYHTLYYAVRDYLMRKFEVELDVDDEKDICI